jgi:hypothetical protein
MTDEERQHPMDFIVAQQAKNAVAIEKLLESQRKLNFASMRMIIALIETNECSSS